MLSGGMQYSARSTEAAFHSTELDGHAELGLAQGRILEPGEEPWHALPTGRFGTAIIGFTPSWFSVSMGTGILSTLIHQAPHQIKGMAEIGTALYLLNCALFTLSLGVTCASFTMYPFVFRHLVNYPPQCFFIGTLPCGLSTRVAATAYKAAPKYGEWASILALVLWWINVVISLTTCIGIPFLMLHVHHLTLDKMTRAWLLPVVPVIVTAAAGSIVATVVQIDHAMTVIAISYVLLGMGMGLALLISALYVHRLTVHYLPDSEVIVSAFLPMGPIGQGAFGPIQLALAGQKVFPSTGFSGSSNAGDDVFVVSTIAALMLWGLGLWWLYHGMYSVIVRRAHGRLKFNMGFWGFIFPLGVFNSATYALAKALPSAFFSYLAVVFMVSLVYDDAVCLCCSGNLAGKPVMLVLSKANSLKEMCEGHVRCLRAMFLLLICTDNTCCVYGHK